MRARIPAWVWQIPGRSCPAGSGLRAPLPAACVGEGIGGGSFYAGAIMASGAHWWACHRQALAGVQKCHERVDLALERRLGDERSVLELLHPRVAHAVAHQLRAPVPQRAARQASLQQLHDAHRAPALADADEQVLGKASVQFEQHLGAAGRVQPTRGTRPVSYTRATTRTSWSTSGPTSSTTVSAPSRSKSRQRCASPL